MSISVPFCKSMTFLFNSAVFHQAGSGDTLHLARGEDRGRQWHPTPVLLPGNSHGQRSLVGCSPWGRWELDTTERLHFHFSLSCIGEGNGNPLQCSCLENPRDGGTWWAAIYGVAQSQTRLKRPSSSIAFEDIVSNLCSTFLKLYFVGFHQFDASLVIHFLKIMFL